MQLSLHNAMTITVYPSLKFAIITAIILPVLPNQSFADVPFDVLNPYKIWLMVVLISGISFLGLNAIIWGLIIGWGYSFLVSRRV